MTLKSFTRSFRRGLGGAIIELSEKPNREEYRNVVMRSSLKDIAYDAQTEGTKGFYLYTAINTFSNPDMFLDRIAEKFSKRLYWGLSEQLFDLLCCFAADGYEKAGNALEKKYDGLKRRLPLMRSFNCGYCERELLEKLMMRKISGGFESFKRCVNDMGKMIKQRGRNDCLWCDMFLSAAEEKFGNRIYSFIESSENEFVAAFSQAYNKAGSESAGRSNLKLMNANDFAQLYKTEPQADKEETVTVELLIKRAEELSKEDNPFPLRISLYAKKFARMAEKKDIDRLAEFIFDEELDFMKAALLRTFNYVDFPLDIKLLFAYMKSGNESIREVTAKALSRFKDREIHSLALQLFDAGQVENALTLLEPNFEIDDEALIRKHVLRSKRLSFNMVKSITSIYNSFKSGSCGDILLHFYKNTECTHCRFAVVETMIYNGVIPQSILEECRYDSYEDTRNLAKNALTGK
ncbi:MAG: hypothetical protein LBS21_02695 [Clostridiales bacterium]|jgi:hypothetical protein|nr:hypothetical protein [Clostridiales bacterium]